MKTRNERKVAPRERLDFARNLREARHAAGLSQRALERAAGLSQNWISQVELGKANISLDTMVKLSRVVGCELSDLLRPLSHRHK